MEQLLYELPDGWEWTDLIKVCTPSRKTIEPDKKKTYNYIGLENIESNTGKLINNLTTNGSEISSTKVIFNQGMVLYGKLRPYLNKVIVAQTDGLATTEIIPFDCSELIDANFLAYFLRTQYFVNLAMNNCSGARMPRATTKLFTKIAKVPLVGINEQKRIVEKLDALFTRIDTAIEHLQESIFLADALYASSLDQMFNPKGSPINSKGTYELPDGWEWHRLEDVVNKTENLNPLKNADQLWTYIDISSIDRDRLTITKPKEILGKDAPSRAKKHIQLNDVIFATTRPNLKNIALVQDNYGSPIASTGFCILRANEKVLPAYLFNYVTTDFVQSLIEPYVSGASYPAITDVNLKKTPIPIPSISKQKFLVEKFDIINKYYLTLKEQGHNKITSLQKLKTSILNSAFKGKF